ncbi:hypothetical protein ALC53_06953, partial [Atta colombica]
LKASPMEDCGDVQFLAESPPTPTHSRPIPSAMCKRHGEKSLIFTID